MDRRETLDFPFLIRRILPVTGPELYDRVWVSGRPKLPPRTTGNLAPVRAGERLATVVVDAIGVHHVETIRGIVLRGG